MKNKHKLMVSLAVLLTLALLTFTGCVSTNTTYDLSNIGTVKISDAIEDVLPSCVVVDVTSSYSTSKYSCVGIAFDKDKILVPTQTLSTDYGWRYTGRIYGSNLKVDLKIDKAMGEELGVSILSVDTKGVELTPIQFGDSDKLAYGELLFGISYDAPIVDSSTPKSEVVADYLLTIPVMVSSIYMNVGTHDFLGVTEEMINTSFTTYGYFNPSEPTYKHYFSQSTSGLAYDQNLSLTNCWIFNTEGKFVGANYIRFVDSSTDKNSAIIGIGYACRSNSIKQNMPYQLRGEQ